MTKIRWDKLALEFFVVVVGVMVALAADRWQQNRNNAEAARGYIERLRSDIETDLRDYMIVVQSSDSVDRSVEYVLRVYRRGEEVPEDDYERFAMAVLASSFAPSPRGTDATYTDLVSSGAFGLIPTSLREAIIGYYQEKSVLIDGRMETFRSAHREGYWQLPSRILGPDVLPELWILRGGAQDDYIPETGALALSPEFIQAATKRLRSIPEVEQRAAQVRYYMTQRKFIYGQSLSMAARELLGKLDDALNN